MLTTIVLNQADLTAIVQSHIRVTFPQFAAPYSHEIPVVFTSGPDGTVGARVDVPFFRPEDGIREAAPGTVGSRDVTMP